MILAGKYQIEHVLGQGGMGVLEKDPARRYQQVADLAAALVPFGSANAGQVAAGIARVSGLEPARDPVHAAATIAGPGGSGHHAAPTPVRAPQGPRVKGRGSAAPRPEDVESSRF